MNIKLVSFILSIFLFSISSQSNASLFRSNTFNVVDAEKAFLLITADAGDSHAQIRYLPSKTELETGINTGAAPFNAGIHAISARDTIRVPIDLTNQAFSSGYGAVQVSSTDDSGSWSSNYISAFLVIRKPRSAHPVGPSVNGRAFRIPVIAPPANVTQRYKVVITTIGAPAYVGVTAPGKLSPTDFEIEGGHSALWDSALQSQIDLNQSGYIHINSYGGAYMAVSTAIYRNGKLWGHVYPAVLE